MQSFFSKLHLLEWFSAVDLTISVYSKMWAGDHAVEGLAGSQPTNTQEESATARRHPLSSGGRTLQRPDSGPVPGNTVSMQPTPRPAEPTLLGRSQTWAGSDPLASAGHSGNEAMREKFRNSVIRAAQNVPAERVRRKFQLSSQNL